MNKRITRPSTWFKLCPINDEKTGGTRLCKPSGPQSQVHRALAQHNKVIVNKYRQSYTTTVGAMWMYGEVMHHPGWRGFLIADDRDTAEEAFSMITTAYDSQPPQLKVPALRSGTRHLVFDNDSRLKILYATKRHLGIGRSADRLVLTEFGMWQNAAKAMQKLAPTYRKRQHAKVLIESTPGPKGCLMETVWLNALEGKGDWHPEFLKWWLDPTATAKPPVGWTPDEGELAYMNEHPGMTLEHAWFRRMLLEGEMQGDTRLFDNQYPGDEYSGFTTSGTPIIPLDAIAVMLKDSTVPAKQGDVWWLKQRTPHMRILICADPNGYGETGDPSGLTVWDLVSQDLLGYWTGRVDPGLFADIIGRVQRETSAEIVAVESNNSACIQSCVDKGVRNLHHTSRMHPGWYATHQRKTTAIAKAVDMLRTQWGISAREVLHQLLVYSTDSEKRLVSDEGSHHCDLAITVFMAADFMAGKYYGSRVVESLATVGVTRTQLKSFMRKAE